MSNKIFSWTLELIHLILSKSAREVDPHTTSLTTIIIAQPCFTMALPCIPVKVVVVMILVEKFNSSHIRTMNIETSLIIDLFFFLSSGTKLLRGNWSMLSFHVHVFFFVSFLIFINLSFVLFCLILFCFFRSLNQAGKVHETNKQSSCIRSVTLLFLRPSLSTPVPSNSSRTQ